MNRKALNILMAAIIVGLSLPVMSVYAQERKNIYVGATSSIYPPPKGHYNTFVTYAAISGFYRELVQEPLAFYLWYNDTYIPWLATSWKIQGDEFIVYLRKGVTWHNGDPFTSKDVACTFYCLYLLKSPVWEYIDEVKEVDPHTVSFHISKPSSVLIRYILREPIRPYSTFGNFSDRLRSLLKEGKTWGSAEVQALVTEFRNYRPAEYIGTGTFMWTGEVTEAEAWLKKNPNHWNAENVKFDWIKVYIGETPVITPMVLGFQVDYCTHGFPPATEMEFYKIGISVYRPPTHFGPAIYFNHKMYPFNITEFRRAINYAINKSENAYVSLLFSAKPINKPTGLPLELEPLWLSERIMNELIDYTYNPGKAAQLLESIGFRKGTDGIWRDKNGKPCEFELMFPAEFADWRAAAENVAAQLTAFGIPITLRAVTYSEITPKFVKEGLFQMAIQSWGVGNPHPHFSFYQDFIYYNFPGEPQPGFSYKLVREIEGLGTVNIEQLVYDCAAGFDIEKQKEVVEKLALIFNKDLPSVPLWERYGNNPVVKDVRVEGWPPPDHWIWQNSVYQDNPVVIMLATGLYIRPVGWTPPSTPVVPEVPEELEEAVSQLTQILNTMRSDLSKLQDSVSKINSALTEQAGNISAATNLSYAAIAIAVISILVSALSFAMRKKP